jgi:beta-glucosidase
VDTPQLYAEVAGHGGPPVRHLIGWSRVTLSPGESRHVSVTADPRLLAAFDEAAHNWKVAGGKVRIVLARNAADTALSGTVGLDAQTIAP